MEPKPKPKTNERPLIATMRLDLSLDLDHELVSLAGVVPTLGRLPLLGVLDDHSPTLKHIRAHHSQSSFSSVVTD